MRRLEATKSVISSAARCTCIFFQVALIPLPTHSCLLGCSDRLRRSRSLCLLWTGSLASLYSEVGCRAPRCAPLRARRGGALRALSGLSEEAFMPCTGLPPTCRTSPAQIDDSIVAQALAAAAAAAAVVWRRSHGAHTAPGTCCCLAATSGTQLSPNWQPPSTTTLASRQTRIPQAVASH